MVRAMRVCSDGRVPDDIDSRTVSQSDPAALRAVAVSVAVEAAAHVRRRRAELFGSDLPFGGDGNSVQTKSTDTDRSPSPTPKRRTSSAVASSS